MAVFGLFVYYAESCCFLLPSSWSCSLWDLVRSPPLMLKWVQDASDKCVVLRARIPGKVLDSSVCIQAGHLFAQCHKSEQQVGFCIPWYDLAVCRAVCRGYKASGFIVFIVSVHLNIAVSVLIWSLQTCFVESIHWEYWAYISHKITALIGIAKKMNQHTFQRLPASFN